MLDAAFLATPRSQSPGKGFRTGSITGKSARYIYCLMPSSQGPTELGPIGLDGAPVYLLASGKTAAVVHNCLPQPYAGSEDQIKVWLLQHSVAVDKIWEISGTVLPCTFDVIVRSGEDLDADEQVCRWLAAGEAEFAGRLDYLRGKVEVGVAVFYQSRSVLANICDPEIRRLEVEMIGKPKGIAYFYQQKIKKIQESLAENFTNQMFNRIYRRISSYALEICLNKNKRGELSEDSMLLNLSLLVERNSLECLGEELDAISDETGLRVRFTGPWPPYSFSSGIKQILL